MLLKFDDKPFNNIEEMNETILKNWNNKITNGDTVYILGDIALRTNAADIEKLIALVARFKGRKVLVKGNYDDVSDHRYKQLFSEICDYKEINDNYKGSSMKLVLSHYPILHWKGQHSGTVLLYGHTYVSIEDDYFKYCLWNMKNYGGIIHENDKPFHAYNVGCMQPYMDYMPRNLEEIIDAKKEEMPEPDRKDIPYYSSFEQCWKVNKWYRLQAGWGWFEDEQPSDEIKAYVEQHLENVNWKVDVVLSHTTPYQYRPIDLFLSNIDQSTVDSSTEKWLRNIEEKLSYEKWYAGHYHCDRVVDNLQIMFKNVELFCSEKDLKFSMV